MNQRKTIANASPTKIATDFSTSERRIPHATAPKQNLLAASQRNSRKNQSISLLHVSALLDTKAALGSECFGGLIVRAVKGSSQSISVASWPTEGIHWWATSPACPATGLQKRSKRCSHRTTYCDPRYRRIFTHSVIGGMGSSKCSSSGLIVRRHHKVRQKGCLQPQMA